MLTVGIIAVGLAMVCYSISEIFSSIGPASPVLIKQLISMLWGWAILFSFIAGILIMVLRKKFILNLCILLMSLNALFYIILYYILSPYEFVITRDVIDLLLPLSCIFYLSLPKVKERFT